MRHDDYTATTTATSNRNAAEAGRVATILSIRSIHRASAKVWKPFLLLVLLAVGCSDKGQGQFEIALFEGDAVSDTAPSRIQVLDSKYLDLDVKLFLISVDSIQYIVTSGGGITPHMVLDSCSELFGLKWRVTPIGVTEW